MNADEQKKKQTRYEDFVKYSAEGIFLLEYIPPIPVDLPPEEQYRLSVERGVIAECNNAIAQMYGFESREEMLGVRYKDLYTDSGVEENLEVNLRFIEAGYRLTDLETEEYNQDGQKVYFLNNVVGVVQDGCFTGTWGTQRDITQLKRAKQELLIAYDTTLQGWAKALELRDYETESHTRRTIEGTVALAEALGVPREDLEHIRRGAILHDIGKMGVPDAILRKPGRFTPEERLVMQEHPTHAYEMLSGIPFLHKALDIPYCHHEHWDGKGYPRGLKGDEIPLAARIFALIDVWDALLSKRAYKEAWSNEDALDYITENSGKHFDPKVVAKFMEFLEKRHPLFVSG